MSGLINFPNLFADVTPATGIFNGVTVTGVDQDGNFLDTNGIPIPVAPARPSNNSSTTSTPQPTSLSSGSQILQDTETNLLQIGSDIAGIVTLGNYGGDVSSGTAAMASQNQSTIQSASSSGLSWIQQIEAWISSHVEDGIVIVVGLILLAAGVFAFKTSQTIIQTGSRIARNIAS